ncbi:90_t:CDS:1, partial [Cetraspora pellucida]
DPCTRAAWLITQYGISHSLFHAIRLGPSFVTVDVIKCLLAQDANMSRYFIQRLLMHYGSYDQQLIELKIKYNIRTADIGRVRAFQKSIGCPWASNLPIE